MTSRRGFLGSIMAAPWVVRSGVLMPVKKIVLPSTATATVDVLYGKNTLITSVFLANEALRVLGRRLHFSESIDRDWAADYDMHAEGTFIVRKPARYMRSNREQD